MKTKLFIYRFPAKQTRPICHLDVTYGFLRSYSPKTSRLPTSRCYGVPQAMDESYTILVQPTGFFQPPMCTLSSYRLPKGLKWLQETLSCNTIRRVRTCMSRRRRPPPPPFLSLFRLTSRQTRRDHLLRSVEFTRAQAPFPR